MMVVLPDPFSPTISVRGVLKVTNCALVGPKDRILPKPVQSQFDLLHGLKGISDRMLPTL